MRDFSAAADARTASGAEADAALIDRFVGEGDRGAFEALVRRHLPALRRFLALRLPDPAEAAEAEQEVLIRVFRSLPSFRGEAGFRTWLWRICALAAADLARGRARERARRLRLFRVASDADPRPSDEPGFALERAEGAAELRRALASLGEPEASLLYLRDAEGLSVEELAEAFGLRAGTVKSRLSRARARMRGLLEGTGRRSPGRQP